MLGVPGLMRILLIAMISMSRLAICLSLLAAASADLTLVDFSDGSPGMAWVTENDPEIGGISTSNLIGKADRLAWGGTVEIVPSLDTPGFCLAYTPGLRNKFADVSGYGALTLRARATRPYAGFKVSFSTSRHLFKADLPAEFGAAGDGAWTDLSIPFTNFTYSLPSYPGEPITRCADDPSFCPTPTDLATITAFDVWAEGVEGPFHLEVQAIGAAHPRSWSQWVFTSVL